MIRSQHKIKKRPDAKAGKKKSIWGPFKRALINIPKNLIRIFVVVVIVSFVWAIYVLTNEEYTKQFLSDVSDTRDYEVKRRVHPLFKFLQFNYDPVQRFRPDEGDRDAPF